MVRLIGKNTAELQQIAHELGMPRFVGRQMADWLYRKQVRTIDEMTNISKANRERLCAEGYEVGRVEPLNVLRSNDGTEKYLFPTEDGHSVETVLIPAADSRYTLCISTQVGCKMNCLFCQTGKQGFQGNLTPADMMAQILYAENLYGLDNIVVMGQGEPCDNLDNLLHTLAIVTADEGMGWSPRRITVSTVGLRKNFQRLLDDSVYNVAVSLHAPLHDGRLELMPAERQFSIEEIVETLRDRDDFHHQRRLSFEYIVLHGINDTDAHARALVRLLRHLPCRVNLIRWHAIPGVQLPTSDDASMLRLRDYLTSHGVFTTIRASRGEDIMAACGMLKSKE